MYRVVTYAEVGVTLDEVSHVFVLGLLTLITCHVADPDLWVPLAALIKGVLDERPGHCAPGVRFKQELEAWLLDSAAKETPGSVINWGCYAEIFSYNDQTGHFSLVDVEF